MKYKIAICDDSVTDQNYVLNLIHAWAAKMHHTIEANTFPSAESFLFRYTDEKNYDILLLDIEMDGMDGVSLAKRVRQDNESVQIVFITGFPDFISEGYEVSALHYLMKPVSAEKLFSVLDKAAANLVKTEKNVIFTVDGEAIRILTRAILYIESLAHYCQIHTLHECIEVRMKISDIEKMLGEGFIRTHRSYLTNIGFIKRITKTDILLDNGEQIPLSRGNYQAVNQAFIRYFRGES